MRADRVTEIWASELPPLDYRHLRVLPQVEHRRIHASEPPYRFLLGVSVCVHRGAYYAAWGASGRDENDAESIFAYATSRDGRTWCRPRPVGLPPAGTGARSHGVLLSTGERLWALAPRARFGDIAAYPELRMEVFRFDSPRHGWHSHAESAPGFWPLGEPQRMTDGNWIVGGAVPHRWPRADAAVAISAGDDLSQWRVVTIPADEVTWGETALLVDGSLVRAFIRPPADGLPLRTAVSDDCGRTWTRQTATNLPVSASKACAGRLSDGRCYLIVNLPVAGLGPRDTLAVFLAPAATAAFRRVGIVRQGPSPAPRTNGAGIGRQWAYPYAHEHAGRLYIAYAGTKENAELSVLELAALAPCA